LPDLDELDRRLTIERLTGITQDPGTNEEIGTWSPLMTVHARKRDVSDGERMEAAEVQAQITTRFKVRWSRKMSGVTPKDRCRCEGVVYDIVGIKDVDGRRVAREITANARADV
jgi:SPP1 family predicted phage head-tail adaptor